MKFSFFKPAKDPKKHRTFITSIIPNLNIFDIIVILAFFIITAFLLNNKFNQIIKWTTVRISIQNPNLWYDGNSPKYWYGEQFTKGNIAYNSVGEKIAEITNVENYDLGGNNRRIFLTVLLKLTYNKKRQSYEYEYKPFAAGSLIKLNFPNIEAQGVVVNVGKNASIMSERIVTIENKRVTAEVADQVKIGDKMVDSENNPVAEILNKSSTTSSTYDYSDIRGKKIITYDPLYRHLILQIKVRAYEQANQFYFVDQTDLRSGEMMYLSFPNYRLNEFQIIGVTN